MENGSTKANRRISEAILCQKFSKVIFVLDGF